MHLPDGIIPLHQAIIYWIITLIIIIIFFYKFSNDEHKEKRIVSVAIYAVFSSIVSSLSIPSPFGVPIHFFVIPLVVILLGPLSATIVSFTSLTFQALALNMGGITSFGANFIVMGVIIAIATHLFYKLFKPIHEQYAIFISTMMGILFATIGQVIILLLSGAINLNTLLATLIPFYLFIAIIEGLSNIIIIKAIKMVKPEIIEIEKI